jgi:hypothetical protein
MGIILDPEPPELQRGPGQGEFTIGGGRGTGVPAIQPPQAEMAQTSRDAATGFGSGVTFGGLPWIEGAATRATGNATDYWSAVDAAAKRSAAAAERSPGAFNTGYIAGSTVVPGGMARAGLSLAGRGAGVLGRSALAAPEGALYGGLGGALGTTPGTSGDLGTNVGQGAALGGVLGPLAPLVGQGFAHGLVRDARDPRVAGSGGWIPKALAEAANTDRQGLLGLQAEHGPRAMLTEGGPSMLGTAQGAVPGGTGQGRAALISALQQRNKEAGGHILGEVDRFFGPEPVPSQLQTQLQKGHIDPMSAQYDAAYNNARAIDANPIALWLEGRIGSTRGPAQDALRQVRGMLDVPGNPGTLDPHPRALGAARTAVRGMRDASDDPAVKASLNSVYDQMTQELRAKVPGIHALDSKRAELGSLQDALGPDSAGSRIFDTGRQGVIRPDELRDTMAEAARPKGVMTTPSMEPDFLRVAARAELGRIVGTNRNDLAKLTQVLAEPQDYNSQKLAIMFGQDRADAIARVLASERQFRDSHQKVVEGSQTAQRAAAVKGQEANYGADAKQMTIPGMAASALNWAKNSLVEGAAARSRDRIAQIMATRDPQQIQAMIPALLEAQPARAQRSRLVRDIIQGGFLGAGSGVIERTK